MSRPFLTARWESLLLLNYVCPASVLEPLVPAGTRLDLWHGEALVSVVGFLFRDTRLLGVPVPFHRHFEEVNLRFYVLRETPSGEIRRAVVFVRELVPKWAIATVARVVYNEPYLAVPMSHHVDLDPEVGGSVEYRWRHQTPYVLRGLASGPATMAESDTEAAFITEHYWGYTRQRDGGTLEYQVEHPSWRVWSLDDSAFEGDASTLYGPAFQGVLSEQPHSAFLAVGSDVAVHKGRRIDV